MAAAIVGSSAGGMVRLVTELSPTGLAFGGPGIPPTFAAGDKDAVTTARSASRVWATIGGGVLNEVFWPHTGRPQLRDLGFLVTGEGFWAEVKRVADYSITMVDDVVPLVTVVHRHERYQLTLEVVCDPSRDCVVVRHRLRNLAPERGPLGLHVLAAPHLGGSGDDNSAAVVDGVLTAVRLEEALTIVSDAGFTLASAGYVGASDGWQDCAQHGAPTWRFDRAEHGNVALTGTLAAPDGELAVGFAATTGGATTLARGSLLEGFDALAAAFTDGWRRWARSTALPAGDDVLDRAVRTSAMVLRVHEDVNFPGAIVASLATPWGFAHDDPGGYHLVWPRDCAESGLALASLGLFDDARRVVRFLAATQIADGHWPQNFAPDGAVYWHGLQLDETALPVILALKLDELGGLHLADEPELTAMVRRACAYLAANAPFTMEDRWEESAGASPFTIAATVAALAGAAASGCLTDADAACAGSLADWWCVRLDDLVHVEGTALDQRVGTAGHYVRIAPPAGSEPTRRIVVANRGGEEVDVGELVGLEFLALVRYGLRPADDPKVVETVKVVDAVLRKELPGGPYFYRYQDDGYGEHDDGSPFDGSGVGRLWPLLAGERGHYAADAGADPASYLQAMVASRSLGGLIPEQVWDTDPIPTRRLFPGRPTGSACPLVWAHSELIKLHALHRTGAHADRLRSVAERYRRRPVPAMAHVRDEVDTTVPACTIRVEATSSFVLHVGVDGWQRVTEVPSSPIGLGLQGAEVPAALVIDGAAIDWTRRDAVSGEWEGVDHVVRVRAQRGP